MSDDASPARQAGRQGSRNIRVAGHRRSSWPGENSDYVVWAYVLARADAPAGIDAMSPEQWRDVVLHRTSGWSSALRTAIRDGDSAATALIDLKSMPRLPTWQPSRVTLIGDAIHNNMTPMAGIGANTALRDPAALAEGLSGASDLIAAIGAFEHEMRAYANPAVALSRDNAMKATRRSPIGRRVFRNLLRVAEAAPPLKRLMFKKSVGRSADVR